jgi:kynurenine 3-monooxygenase
MNPHPTPLPMGVLYMYNLIFADPRKCEFVKGRSINLALSHRGRQALKHVGLEEKVIEKGIRMYGRRCHDKQGFKWTSPYGKSDQVSVQ